MNFGLQLLKEKVACCIKCPELVANRTQTVFAGGNSNAELMIVGEAPGRQEDMQGLPFVGDAGELLTNILKACGLSREDVYIVNVLKCQPPNNRNPTDEEISNCLPYLEKQIELINPKHLLVLGSVASKTLFGEFVNSLRGKWLDYKGIPAICSYHPAFLLRSPESKKEAGKDFRMLLKKIRA